MNKPQRILIFGDSNSWGFAPYTNELDTARRYAGTVRWPGIMADELRNQGFEIELIEEALPGRTTVFDDPIEGEYKNGRRYLQACLESHAGLDLVIIMLGTNDCKGRFGLSAFDIAKGAGLLIDTVGGSGCGPEGGAPRVLLIAPPPLGTLSFWAQMFSGGLERSQGLAAEYEKQAELHGADFFDAGRVIETDGADGVHFSEEMHVKLGKAVASTVNLK